jgi:hypothetical protein
MIAEHTLGPTRLEALFVMPCESTPSRKLMFYISRSAHSRRDQRTCPRIRAE